MRQRPSAGERVTAAAKNATVASALAAAAQLAAARPPIDAGYEKLLAILLGDRTKHLIRARAATR